LVGITGILAPSQVLRHRLKFFHDNCSDDLDLFERLRDEITKEIRNLFTSFSAALSEVHLRAFLGVVLVGVDKQQKIRTICWSPASAPDFSAVEFDDDFICLGGEKATSYAQSLLSLISDPTLDGPESLSNLEWTAQKVSKEYPDWVSPSGFSFLVCPKQTNVEVAVMPNFC